MTKEEQLEILQTVIQQITEALNNLYDQKCTIAGFFKQKKLYFQIFDNNLEPIKTYEIKDIEQFSEIANNRIIDLLNVNPHFENKEYLVNAGIEYALEHFIVPNFVDESVLQKILASV